MHWEAIFRFFFRKFPVEVNEMTEFHKTVKRPWYYRTESCDPLWDKLFFEYRALKAYALLRLYYQKGGP